MSDKRKIILGGKYRHHDNFNTEYIVNKVLIDATGEEETGKLGEFVLYTQTVAGIYPVGTQYVRSVKDFLSKTKFKGKIVNKFDLIDEPKKK